jgi:mRNA-degrading endonuclease YafQ of YafQ-DinJ toxin-antitoxin module
MKIEMTNGFLSRYAQRANKSLKKETINAIKLFRKNANTTKLKLKSLDGDLSKFHSINVNKDYRIIMKIKRRKKEVTAIFFNFGTHDQLYYKPKPDRITEHYYIM